MGDLHVAVRVATKVTGRRCRSCGEALTFYETAARGRSMPFTGDPPVSNVGADLFGVETGYIEAGHAHHATCPGAAQWRRG